MKKKLGMFVARKVGITVPSKAGVKLGERFDLTQKDNDTFNL